VRRGESKGRGGREKCGERVACEGLEGRERGGLQKLVVFVVELVRVVCWEEGFVRVVGLDAGAVQVVDLDVGFECVLYLAAGARAEP